jgi:hypothetical protein
MRIEEGRLVERTCPDCDGIERRAFGEAISPRGELSSYAIGWTSGHEKLVGHMTVGIGAGNPGGGSFHMEVHADEAGDPGLTLVDRPFEDVPEGGPDLSREEALVHDTLRFVWWVADEVLIQDRRANWMVHWILQTSALATWPVIDGTAPVRHVVREADGVWQLLCGTVEAEDPQVYHLFHAFDRDPSLVDVADLPAGTRADRRRVRGWKRHQI